MFNTTVIVSGLFPSWLLASSHVLEISKSIYTSFSVGGVSVSPTVATFLILAGASLFTVTSKLTDVVSFALTSTFFHSNVVTFFPSTSFSVLTTFSSNDSSTKVVPSGTVSVIVVIASFTFESFFTEIVYLIVWPGFTKSSFVIGVASPSTTKLATLFDVITGFSVLLVSFLLTVALFSIKVIDSISSPSTSSIFTVTLKETSIVSPALTSFSHTILWISFR